MTYWLVPANNKTFRIHNYLENYDEVDWVQNNYKYNPGDFVFIYCSLPEARIRYLFRVERINIPYDVSFKDSIYWGENHEPLSKRLKSKKYFRMKLLGAIDTPLLGIEKLKDNGLKKAPQGSVRIQDNLLSYILKIFDNYSINTIDNGEEDLFEGLKQAVLVNKYERNPIARAKCLALKGTTCSICGLKFEDKYGELGKGFIHVHHIVPISTKEGEYKIDYERDLIPVCPNCHAMLHHKINGRTLSVEELKELVLRKKYKV